MSNRFRFEAETRLIRWGESSSAGRTITLELPPDDGAAHPFRGFPTGHTHGQRFRMQFDAIDDSEQVAPGDEPASDNSINNSKIDGKSAPQPAGSIQRQRYAAMSPAEQAVTRAAMLPKDERFQAWAAQQWPGGGNFPPLSETETETFIRSRCCGGKSRRLIAEVPEYLDRFLALETSYRIDIGELPRPR